MRPAPGTVSVVMPTFDAADLLGLQLAALGRQTYEGEWEVVVADNGSTDATCAVAEAWAGAVPSLRVVDASDLRGVSHARNVGARAAKGDFIVLCDADDVVDPGWLAAMARAATSFDLVAGYLDPEPLNDEATRSWRPPLSRHDLPHALDFLPYAMGANCGVWADVFADLGGWREDFVGGGDDIDFSWRAQLRSYRLGFAADAVIAYRYRSGLRSLFRQYANYGLADPQLARAFRDHGLVPEPAAAGLRVWLRLAAEAPRLLGGRATRGRYVRRVAYRWGRLRGSIRYRILAL